MHFCMAHVLSAQYCQGSWCERREDPDADFKIKKVYSKTNAQGRTKDRGRAGYQKYLNCEKTKQDKTMANKQDCDYG